MASALPTVYFIGGWSVIRFYKVADFSVLEKSRCDKLKKIVGIIFEIAQFNIVFRL